MLKKDVIIVLSHCKDAIISVYLLPFNSVIINITKFNSSFVANSLEYQRFPSILETFFYGKNFTLLTYKNVKTC